VARTPARREAHSGYLVEPTYRSRGLEIPSIGFGGGFSLFPRLILEKAPGWAVLFSALYSAAAAFYVGTRPALAACACAQPAIIVVPRPGDVAPRNSHIWISVPPALADVQASFRGPGAGPADTVRYGSGEERIIELVPRAPLAGHTRYEVLLGSEVVGQLVTGDTMDQTPPTWDGLKTGEVSPGTDSGCGAGETLVVLGLGKRDDDATPAASLRYAIWIGAQGKDIDYTQPPTTVVTANRDHLALGRESRCNPANLDLQGAFAVGVRVLDLAGNAGEPSEADIKLPAKSTSPPRGQIPPQK
jgi:hypothetical protein